MARKGSAQAKRAMKLASSRGISLKSAWGIVKRGGGKRRKVARASSPRRRRTRMSNSAPRRRYRAMGRTRKNGGRKRGTVITPKRIAKALVVVDGVRRAFEPQGVVDEIKFIVTHAQQISKEGSKSVMQHAKQLGSALIVPVVEIVVAPKLIDKGVAFVSKGEPMLGKLANAKLLKIGG